MPVTVVWESRFKRESADAGFEVTRRIWRDMRSFEGYVRHHILRDLDDPGHLLVVSQWSSREAADRIRDEYASSPNAVRANSLVSEPRRRYVTTTTA